MKKITRIPSSIILALLTLAALASCGSKGYTTLKGEITGLGNDTLYLYGTDPLYPHIDTIATEAGRFEARLKTDTLVSLYLQLPDGTRIPLFADRNQHITLQGKAGQPHTFAARGNQACEELTDFNHSLQTLGKPSIQALQQKAEDFIRSHTGSLASIHLLNKYFVDQPEPDWKRIRTLTDSMEGTLKDRPYIAQLLKGLQEEEKSAVGRTIPYFRLPNSKGKSISRNDFPKHYLLINFWASWDHASRQANAPLRRLYQQEKKNEKIGMLGISLDVDKDAWQAAIKADTLQWEQACDRQAWETNIVKQLRIHSLPATVLVNPQGRIEARNLTPADIDRWLKKIKN